MDLCMMCISYMWIGKHPCLWPFDVNCRSYRNWRTSQCKTVTCTVKLLVYLRHGEGRHVLTTDRASGKCHMIWPIESHHFRWPWMTFWSFNYERTKLLNIFNCGSSSLCALCSTWQDFNKRVLCYSQASLLVEMKEPFRLGGIQFSTAFKILFTWEAIFHTPKQL